MRARSRLTGALLTLAAALTVGAAPAYAAASSTIDHVQTADGTTRVVVSLADVPAGAAPDLGSVRATFDGAEVPATASPLSESSDLRRTAVLAMDVSVSMRGQRFEQAKLAAEAFLDRVPANVHVGVVTFAGEVAVAQQPTLDRDAVRDVINGLTLTRWTRVHEGVIQAVRLAGDTGARSVLVLSDGEDTSRTPVSAVTTAVADAGVQVDVVALGREAHANQALQQIAVAGDGQVLSTDDPDALSALFADEASALDRQVLVTLTPGRELAGGDGSLQVSLDVGGTTVTDDAFVALPRRQESAARQDGVGHRLAPAEQGFVMPAEWLYAGLAVSVVAVAALLVAALGGGRREDPDDVDKRIEAYTRRGARRLVEARAEQPATVGRQAVAVAENVLERQEGLESALGDRLEAAGMAVKPAEWLLLHAGITVGAGLLGLLLTGGRALVMVVGLALGAVLPWLYLGLKRRRRVAAFKAQLADTLQLMAGSLSAGLSLAQSVDTVVREGADPIAAEFRRALVEARLGVDIEDALAGVAERMESVDFQWVVMAIRIQRDVGGNLSELLAKVSETIREREYLERQVKSLSAEGRLSVYVLAGLPPGFMLYLLLVNPTYLHPMFTHPLGIIMLGTMAVLLVAGTLWMKKLVKVEV